MYIYFLIIITNIYNNIFCLLPYRFSKNIGHLISLEIKNIVYNVIKKCTTYLYKVF